MRLGIVAYIVPFMWIYKPVLLMRGSPADIAVTIITSAIGVIALGGAIEGYMLTKASTFQRLVLGIAAVFLIMPGSSTDLLGGALLTLLILLQWRAARKVPT
jgi:TRAP-type uncharacterized transport system fused permease subunit